VFVGSCNNYKSACSHELLCICTCELWRKRSAHVHGQLCTYATQASADPARPRPVLLKQYTTASLCPCTWAEAVPHHKMRSRLRGNKRHQDQPTTAVAGCIYYKSSCVHCLSRETTPTTASLLKHCPCTWAEALTNRPTIHCHVHGCLSTPALRPRPTQLRPTNAYQARQGGPMGGRSCVHKQQGKRRGHKFCSASFLFL
jgi:hypothetical protein